MGSAPGQGGWVLLGSRARGREDTAGGRVGMDLVSEDLDDPTSNCRREAGTAAGRNNSSRLYYDIRSSNSRAWESTAPDDTRDRGHCSRNIHWALAWNRILSSRPYVQGHVSSA